MTVKNYITRRKLVYALYDLSRGKRIIDVAMDYGFETHAGFTKAFKRCFGCPPSLYRLHVAAAWPQRVTIERLKAKEGGMKMQVKIVNAEPLVVAGYPFRYCLPGVSGISDIPVFWDTINMNYGASLSTLHHTYAKSHHCEVGICFDVDEENHCFTYMIGVGVDPADRDTAQRPGTYLRQIPGGLYAVFTTPLVEEDLYPQSIRETWQKILTDWLPGSDYEYDSGRDAFEYYDERDHAWLHDGKSQMDIYLPVCKRGQ